MKLPDFVADASLNQLRSDMGADLNAAYSADRVWVDTDLLDLLGGVGADVEAADITVVAGLLEYKGQKVLLYIRDQYQNEVQPLREYKYHIAHCQTLERMWAEGRSKRYVVATRSDGQFHVVTHYHPSGRQEPGLIRMNVCKNCLQVMRREHPERRSMWAYGDFDLQRFFGAFNTRHTRLPVHTDGTAPRDAYPENWDEISRGCRERADWKCERCGRDFRSEPYRLHTHHKDRQKWNNLPSNLEALCVQCHRKATELAGQQESLFRERLSGNSAGEIGRPSGGR